MNLKVAEVEFWAQGGHPSGQDSGEKKFDQKSKKGKENLAHSKMTVGLLADGHPILPSRVESSEVGVSNLILSDFLPMGKRDQICDPNPCSSPFLPMKIFALNSLGIW